MYIAVLKTAEFFVSQLPHQFCVAPSLRPLYNPLQSCASVRKVCPKRFSFGDNHVNLAFWFLLSLLFQDFKSEKYFEALMFKLYISN